MAWVFVAAGLVLLTVGAECLIRGATGLARRLGLSELLIGLTLVGFGTSTPELVSSIQAALAGSPDIALGNVVGSNIANILLILGLSALIAPVTAEPKAFRRDAPALAAATILMISVAMTGEFGRIAGGVFLTAMAAYVVFAFLTERRASAQAEAERHMAEAAALPETKSSVLVAIFLSLIGLALLAGGAKMLVLGAIDVAISLGVSETIIGLTVVAVGTSLPELVTSVIAATRGKSELALGNVVGSNLYNILAILGATALIKPVSVAPEIIRFDNWVMLAATAALIIFASTRNKVERWEGAVLSAAYIVYIVRMIIIA
jgi:cation:H+ antiporter